MIIIPYDSKTNSGIKKCSSRRQTFCEEGRPESSLLRPSDKNLNMSLFLQTNSRHRSNSFSNSKLNEEYRRSPSVKSLKNRNAQQVGILPKSYSNFFQASPNMISLLANQSISSSPDSEEDYPPPVEPNFSRPTEIKDVMKVGLIE